MADAIWADLSTRHGYDRAQPETWSLERPMHFQNVVRSGAFARLERLGVPELAAAFLGDDAVHASKRWGQPLVTFPAGGWDVPHATWHLDLLATASLDVLPAIRVFAFVDAVAARGGGTPYIAGSHRVVVDRARQAGRSKPLRSSDMRAALKAEEPWLAALMSPGGGDRVTRFMRVWGAMRGFPVRVEEMTGEPGDIIVMHPAMFHTVAPNGLERPRMMLVETFSRKGVLGHLT